MLFVYITICFSVSVLQSLLLSSENQANSTTLVTELNKKKHELQNMLRQETQSLQDSLGNTIAKNGSFY